MDAEFSDTLNKMEMMYIAAHKLNDEVKDTLKNFFLNMHRIFELNKIMRDTMLH